MPPKSKITREMIIDAAYETVRESGEENLNARSIAERLGCSTQPVLYVFRTMDEIRECVYRKADEYHSEYLMKGRYFLSIKQRSDNLSVPVNKSRNRKNSGTWMVFHGK